MSLYLPDLVKYAFIFHQVSLVYKGSLVIVGLTVLRSCMIDEDQTNTPSHAKRLHHNCKERGCEVDKASSYGPDKDRIIDPHRTKLCKYLMLYILHYVTFTEKVKILNVGAGTFSPS